MMYTRHVSYNQIPLINVNLIFKESDGNFYPGFEVRTHERERERERETVPRGSSAAAWRTAIQPSRDILRSFVKTAGYLRKLRLAAVGRNLPSGTLPETEKLGKADREKERTREAEESPSAKN